MQPPPWNGARLAGWWSWARPLVGRGLQQAAPKPGRAGFRQHDRCCDATPRAGSSRPPHALPLQARRLDDGRRGREHTQYFNVGDGESMASSTRNGSRWRRRTGGEQTAVGPLLPQLESCHRSLLLSSVSSDFSAADAGISISHRAKLISHPSLPHAWAAGDHLRVLRRLGPGERSPAERVASPFAETGYGREPGRSNGGICHAPNPPATERGVGCGAKPHGVIQQGGVSWKHRPLLRAAAYCLALAASSRGIRLQPKP